MARRCLTCRRMCGASRCTECTKQRKRRRNADAPLARALCATATNCARCGRLLDHANPQSKAGPTAQHTVRFADGGRLRPTDPVLCRSCNASLG